MLAFNMYKCFFFYIVYESPMINVSFIFHRWRYRIKAKLQLTVCKLLNFGSKLLDISDIMCITTEVCSTMEVF